MRVRESGRAYLARLEPGEATGEMKGVGGEEDGAGERTDEDGLRMKEVG